MSEQSRLLSLLHVTPSVQSIDYVTNKREFHLHQLLTEQRHANTMELTRVLRENTKRGMELLLSVDEDISKKLEWIAETPAECSLLEHAAAAIALAIRAGRKVYVYGCGSTGRLAKLLESTIWRRFWSRLKASSLGSHIERVFPNMEERFIGEMTGADRALISSLEGFEDLQLIGRLQLQDRGVQQGDVVFAITEGGETSSVIGTILAAADLNKNDASEKNLYFVYNNPDDVLHFERSLAVLARPEITKIRLFTGPQGIAGSTRMQATTSELFVMGTILECAIHQLLQPVLSLEELNALGFEATYSISRRLSSFRSVQQAVLDVAGSLCSLTELEASTYEIGGNATYIASDALLTVFTDTTERSPTFRLRPLDTIESQRMSLVQVLTPVRTQGDAWRVLLGRSFRGLQHSLYATPFEHEIGDPFLRHTALESLKKAGDDQRLLYDFSTSDRNLQSRGPHSGDLGVAIFLSNERKHFEDQDLQHVLGLFNVSATCFIIQVEKSEGIPCSGEKALQEHKVDSLETSPVDKLQDTTAGVGNAVNACMVIVNVPARADPLQLDEHVALKMLLNAHSTAVMGMRGFLVGNTMTNVQPSNLKLLGRATYLIEMHVNHTLHLCSLASMPEQTLATPPEVPQTQPPIAALGRELPPEITYAEANAVLFDAIDFVQHREPTNKGCVSEVALSIIRILETSRKGDTSWSAAEHILSTQSLAEYLHSLVA